MNAKQAKKEKSSETFTAEERAAMRERVREQKAAGRKADGEKLLLEKLAEMDEPDQALGRRLHELIKATAPDLTPRTWYGMPAYEKDGKVVCFYQSAGKFKVRYATLGFSDSANLDDGDMWATAFAISELTPAVEAKVVELVEKAVT